MARTQEQRMADVVQRLYARLSIKDYTDVTAKDKAVQSEAEREFGRDEGKNPELLADLFVLLDTMIRSFSTSTLFSIFHPDKR